MKRVISIALGVFGLAMLITGIWNMFPPFDTMFFPAHVIPSSVFGILLIIHVWLNWKPIIRYFKGLGWWWILAGVGFLLVIWAGIVVPVFYISGVW
ncbi:hypothetical protein ACFLXU_02585 [Chloroflexota bacterium]